MKKAPSQQQRLPRVFVGSSGANLSLARALDHYLSDVCLLTVWDQQVFRPSTFAFAELVREAERSDFAIFVAGNDEKRARGASPPFLLNQNVVLEMGLFASVIGLDHVYLVVPSDFKKMLQLPSDLDGLTLVPYNVQRLNTDGNELAAVASAGSKLRNVIKEGDKSQRRLRLETRLFPDWTQDFSDALGRTSRLSVCFIHSRRWRENHGDVIRARAAAGHVLCRFLVPDIRDEELVLRLTRRFDDGPRIPAMLSDLFAWLIELKEAAPSTDVHLLRRAPSYSYYRFDEHAYLALYPNANRRRASPTMACSSSSSPWAFLVEDEGELIAEHPSTDLPELRDALASFDKRWLPVPGGGRH